MTSCTVTIHWLYWRRFLKTLMDAAELLLTTAAMPAWGPTVGPFGPSVFVPPNVPGWPVPRPCVPPGFGIVGFVPRFPGPGVVVVVSPGWACSSSGDRYRNSPLV